MRIRVARGLAAVLFIASLGAAQGPNAPEARRDNVSPTGVKQSQTKTLHPKSAYQVGTASWYGSAFHGKTTASGEPYNMYDLTAAHPTLPIGSWVRVTNLRNRRVVTVRINDRGPIIPDRIIDLSYTAAEALDFETRGLQTVRLDLVQPRTEALLQPVAY